MDKRNPRIQDERGWYTWQWIDAVIESAEELSTNGAPWHVYVDLLPDLYLVTMDLYKRLQAYDAARRIGRTAMSDLTDEQLESIRWELNDFLNTPEKELEHPVPVQRAAGLGLDAVNALIIARAERKMITDSWMRATDTLLASVRELTNELDAERQAHQATRAELDQYRTHGDDMASAIEEYVSDGNDSRMIYTQELMERSPLIVINQRENDQAEVIYRYPSDARAIIIDWYGINHGVTETAEGDIVVLEKIVSEINQIPDLADERNQGLQNTLADLLERISILRNEREFYGE